MTLVLACSDCTYGVLQLAMDTNGIELKMLQEIHNKTFTHNAVIRQANLEDMLKYTKKKEK